MGPTSGVEVSSSGLGVPSSGEGVHASGSGAPSSGSGPLWLLVPLWAGDPVLWPGGPVLEAQKNSSHSKNRTSLAELELNVTKKEIILFTLSVLMHSVYYHQKQIYTCSDETKFTGSHTY